MRPYLLQGHSRPITVVQYNYDGDLLFTASKDQTPSVWKTTNGERLGTFSGHKGTVWDLDCDRFTKRLLTASADTNTILWDCSNGQSIRVYNHTGPVRGVRWNEGCTQFATICDPFMEYNAKISIFNCPLDYSRTNIGNSSRNESKISDDEPLYDPDTISEMLPTTPILEIDINKVNGKRINPTNIQWFMNNEYVIVSFDNGMIRFYEPSTGEMVNEIVAHEKKINRIRMNRKKTLLITSSADYTSKLYNPFHMKTHLKTYKTDRPVNDAVISETKDHILLGGGQEAMSVTTTAGKVGKFETRFFHTVYEEEFGTVKGHFGPINACTYYITVTIVLLDHKIF